MKIEIKIYKKGIEEYSKTTVFFGNFMMILWFGLGMVACWFFNPLIAWIYIAFAVIMVFVILRKLLCANCYYFDKRCAMGWGKISSIFFKKGDIEKFPNCIGIKLAPITYGLLTLVPLVLIIISMIQNFSISKIFTLILLLAVSYYSGAIARKKTCAKCKMKLICPGCAVKD